MSIALKNVEQKGGGMLDLSYVVTHITPGDGGTHLDLPMVIRIEPGRPVLVSMSLKDCAGPTPDAAMDKLASWLERAAEALRKRPPSVSLPL